MRESIVDRRTDQRFELAANVVERPGAPLGPAHGDAAFDGGDDERGHLLRLLRTGAMLPHRIGNQSFPYREGIP